MTNTAASIKLETTDIESGPSSSKPYYVPGDLIDFGFSKSFVYGGVKSGDIPSKRIGAKIIIDHAWVKETFDLTAAYPLTTASLAWCAVAEKQWPRSR